MRGISDVLSLMATSKVSNAPEVERVFVAETLSRICECFNTEPAINFFLEREADLDKVLQIFIRINSGGLKLSYSDLLLSIATASWKGVDARQEIHALVDELNSYSDELTVSRDFVLKACLVLSDIRDIGFKVNNFNAENMALIEARWPSIKDSLRLTMQLVRSFGLTDRSLLSNNALIPIAFYLRQRDAKAGYLTSTATAEDRKSIRSWLAIVLLKGVFGSAADTVMAAIRGVIAEAPCTSFPTAEIGIRLADLNRSVRYADDEIEGLLAVEYGDRRAFLVLSLLYPDVDYTNPFHIDHVHPRSKLTERHLLSLGLTPEAARSAAEARDTLANLQLLHGGPNQAKSDLPFENWLAQQYQTAASRGYFLATHHFPDMEAFTSDRFLEFCVARRNVFFTKLKEVVGAPTSKPA